MKTVRVEIHSDDPLVLFMSKVTRAELSYGKYAEVPEDVLDEYEEHMRKTYEWYDYIEQLTK